MSNGAARRQRANAGKTAPGGRGGKGGGPRGPIDPPGKRAGDCVYAGEEYSEGAIIEQGGTKQKCVDGKWVDLNEPTIDRPDEDRDGGRNVR